MVNNITRAFTKLNPSIFSLFNLINLPDKFLAIHLRFGDTKHSVSKINERTNEYLNNIDFILLLYEKYILNSYQTLILF